MRVMGVSPKHSRAPPALARWAPCSASPGESTPLGVQKNNPPNGISGCRRWTSEKGGEPPPER
jgi:hypothetical protein